MSAKGWPLPRSLPCPSHSKFFGVAEISGAVGDQILEDLEKHSARRLKGDKTAQQLVSHIDSSVPYDL